LSRNPFDFLYSRLVVLLTTIYVRVKRLGLWRWLFTRSTQPGHPSVDRRSKYTNERWIIIIISSSL